VSACQEFLFQLISLVTTKGANISGSAGAVRRRPLIKHDPSRRRFPSRLPPGRRRRPEKIHKFRPLKKDRENIEKRFINVKGQKPVKLLNFLSVLCRQLPVAPLAHPLSAQTPLPPTCRCIARAGSPAFAKPGPEREKPRQRLSRGEENH
jgi:hypothetical protein